MVLFIWVHSFSAAILWGYVSHGLLVSFHDICTLFHRLTAISGHLGPHLCQASFWPTHVCVSRRGWTFQGKKPAWHFWLVKLNMWLLSSKADPCPSVAKLAFKSTNVHLQLLLLQDHLLWSRARTCTSWHIQRDTPVYCCKVALMKACTSPLISSSSVILIC